ncbi:hydroquinone glucosyltransferase-like isoform X2 [Prosopis cineraria]|uniref:hydroquinone glucosyltransferase-like isoform X2 n=1 Tax=Prosopis cineraria TaxID=364024 RepID=UPI0024102669|nr:hydroquinone glucosyltransferase-like isoform X2 [Prosopis cineraria]
MEAITEIAVVTVPAYSHQASILEFCKRLVLLQNHGHHFHVTCFIPTLGSPPSASISLVRSLPSSSITCTFLPPVNLHDQPKDLPMEVQLHLAITRSMPLVHDALKSLVGRSSSGLAAMVAEPLSIEALEIAKELNITSYLYFPCSAMLLSLCFYSAKLNQKVSCGDQFRDLPEPIQIPGCVPVSGKDLPDNHQDRSSLAYEQFLQRCQLYHLAQGILLNSFEEMEAGAIRAWQEHEKPRNGETRRYPSVHAIGPIIRTGSSIQINGSGQEHWDDCLRWLDKQPPSSVLFVSFGSGGRLSQAQINELALGLELSNQRFLWVNVRSPSDTASASYLRDNNNKNEQEDPLHFLPSGFLERTKERGLVMACWAPQVEVLGHSSTGAFLSHCGWNSILESIVEGVPIIAWPLFAEQRTNAAMLADGLKVATRPRVSDHGEIVEKEEICRVIRCIMEGEEEEGSRCRREQRASNCLSRARKDTVLKNYSGTPGRRIGSSSGLNKHFLRQSKGTE